jgi:hypothetical protein
MLRVGGRNASLKKGFPNLPGHLINPRARPANPPTNILDGHLAKQDSQRLKLGREAFDYPADVETEVQCLHRGRGRTPIENVQHIGVAGVFLRHQILTKEFRRAPTFAHDKYGGMIAGDATHEAVPIASGLIELWGAVKKIKDHLLLQVLPII